MKLIIDIPEVDYMRIIKYQNVSGCGNMLTNAIGHGTPLDDVKAEIADIYCGQYCENPMTADAMREMILDILDNIGKRGVNE